MGRLVGPHEKRAPAPLPRSLATQTLSCPNRSFRCKARPNQCHAPQVGGRRWACSRLGRPGQSRVSVGRPDQAPPVPEIRRGKQSSDDPNTRVRVRPRRYWGRMMPEKILGTRSARSGGLSASARPGGHWGRMIARPVVASPCNGLSGPQTVQDQLQIWALG